MPLVQPSALTTIAEIGVGTVGASWSAVMLAKGLHVRAYDPAPNAKDKAVALIRGAWPSLVDLQVARDSVPPLDRLTFHATIEEAVASAQVVQENTPEDLAQKRDVFARVGAAAGASVVVLSSTGGIVPSALQAFCPHPDRLVIFHPFNPTHLVPLVEIVPGERTAPAVVDWAMEFARLLGKTPIRLNAELPGHMTNRLQFALVREAVRCIVEGVASARDVDAAVRYGLAPRWMLMGGLQTLHLAGGYGGMRAILDHAGPAIETWWRPGEEFGLTETVKAMLVEAGAELSNERSIEDWMAWRDAELVPLLRAQSVAEFSQPGTRARRHRSMSADPRAGWSAEVGDCLQIQRRGALAILTLNRPEKRNALSDALVLSLTAAFGAVPEDVEAIVLNGAGDHFCGGLDLNELRETDIVESFRTSKIGQALNNTVQYCRVPVVTAPHGAVVGGGLELAAATHVRVAEPSAFYALPEGMRGIFLGSGGSVRLPRLIGADTVMDMMLTGRVYGAQEAHSHLRLAQYLAAEGEGLAQAIKLAERIVQNAPLANFAVVQAMPRIVEQSPTEGFFTEMLMVGIAQNKEEAKRRLRAFLVEKRDKVRPT